MIRKTTLIDVFGIQRRTINIGVQRNTKTFGKWDVVFHDNTSEEYIIYNSLPQSIKDKLPSQEILIKQALEEAKSDNEKVQLTIHLQSEIIKHKKRSDFDFYMNDKKLDLSKSNDLVHAAAILRFLMCYKSSKDVRNISPTLQFDTKRDLRLAVLQYIIQENEERNHPIYGMNVSNYATLHNKELKFTNTYKEVFQQSMNLDMANKAAIATLVHANQANDHRKIIGAGTSNNMSDDGDNLNEFHARTLLYIAQNHGKRNILDIENIYLRYTKECAGADTFPTSLSAVKNWLKSKQHLIDRERLGFAQYDKQLPHLKGEKPKYALAKGGFDGLLFKLPYINKDGNEAQLTVLAIFDYYSEAITGYDWGYVENGLMIRRAYKMHLKNTGGLGFLELESDRFAGALSKDSTEFFSRCGLEISPTAPDDIMGMANSNSKSRYFERLILELKRPMQNYEEFKGLSVKRAKSPKSFPNPDYKPKVLSAENEAVAKVIELVKIYNLSTEGRKKSRWEMFTNNIHPDAPAIPLETQIFLSCPTPKVVSVRNSFITITVNGTEYIYLFTEWQEYAKRLKKVGSNYQVKVYFDEEELQNENHKVSVFGFYDEKDNTKDWFITSLSPVDKAYRDKSSQTGKDLKIIGQMHQLRQSMQTDHNRKSLESAIYHLECKLYGQDSASEEYSNLNVKELSKRLQSLQSIAESQGINIMHTPQELYESAFVSEDAKQHQRLAERELIHDRKLQVPVTIEERKKAKDLQDELLEELYKKRTGK